MTALVFLLMAGCYLFASDDKVSIAPAKPREGVFFTYTGYETMILELKGLHFRYWFESDVKFPNEPTYPLTGTYSVNSDTITLNNRQISQSQWTFRTLNGFISLWRPNAISDYEKYKDLNSYRVTHYGNGSILVYTDKPAEEVWKHRRAPSSGPDAYHVPLEKCTSILIAGPNGWTLGISPSGSSNLSYCGLIDHDVGSPKGTFDFPAVHKKLIALPTDGTSLAQDYTLCFGRVGNDGKTWAYGLSVTEKKYIAALFQRARDRSPDFSKTPLPKLWETLPPFYP